MKTNKNIIYALIISSSLLLCSCEQTSDVQSMFEDLKVPDFELDYPVGEINQSNIVTQNFISPFDSLSSLELYGATYKRQNKGTVDICLYVSQDNTPIREMNIDDLALIYSWSLNAEDFEDNTLISLPIDASSLNHKLKGHECLITISSSDSVSGEAVTFWSTPDDYYPEGCLQISGFDQYNDLWFNIKGYKKSH